MLMQWLSQLLRRRKGQYRNSSTNTTIDATVETVSHGAEMKSNEICTNTGVPKANIPDVPAKPNDQDWTSRNVQVVFDRAQLDLPTEMTEVFKKPGSHILNLPDEIILLIIKNLYEGSDKPSIFAFFVLRQVSQRFRRLVRDGMFLSHVFSDRGCCEWCTGGFRGKWTRINPKSYELHCFETKVRKAGMDIEGLATLIRAERICKTCRPEFESRKRTGVPLDCKFAARTGRDWMYCCACEVEHPTLCFSSDQILKQSNRVCIGRTGYIRMCAHEVLTWDELNAGLRDGNDVSTRFEKSCKHPSHYFHHNDDRLLPTAKAEGNKDFYYLHLSAGIHTKTPNGTYGQSDGRNGYAEYRNHTLPLGMLQMAREFDGKSPRAHAEKMSGQTASISCHDCFADYECRKIWYTRSMLPKAPAHDLPGHSWYHAISPESYSYAGTCGVPETCSDPLCRNYYSSGLRYWHAIYGYRYRDDGHGKPNGSDHLLRARRDSDLLN